MERSTIEQLISEFLKHLPVAFEAIDVREADGHTIFNIRSKDSRLLIGVNGDTLRALNTLVRRMIENKKDIEVPAFLIDVNGYYDKRIYHLKQQAKLLANRARTFKSDVPMPPMNPYERMVVHALFANDPEVCTESAGLGKDRHVVIRYRTPERERLNRDAEFLKQDKI